MSESIFDVQPKRPAGRPLGRIIAQNGKGLGPGFRGASHEITEVLVTQKPQIARADDIQSFYADEDLIEAALIKYSRAQRSNARAFALMNRIRSTRRTHRTNGANPAPAG